ncbi:MAG TPA: NADH-quinone oxidoreductase subunit L [Phycisphaerae bacterium]|jgi:NADH-quinone oxidoreductase subunit L|nr:NADH-quinone oxidoreductase subunit L [Phycisphaerae bacterium]HOJ55813.1 NADH-quinone oxidoreductase subunit L [Phycisphaerae bacterium]HOL25819.1 NADH-quinone oxidoreductase subunit L [Phycisphaerae bacterium]HPP21307.1 NADH-quinone oxidoreductase subunit L [Phycisphaerae bacterium]HPU32027.1 NADH-quinone oxidoreductase subunit L [Phycisphaerae bacterium]
MSSLEIMLVAGVAVPLVSFLLLALFGARLGKPASGWVATAAIATSCVLATIVLYQWHFAGVRPEPHVFTWANLGTIPLKVGVNLDSLTVIMFFMVTFIATWIHVFSIGYMAGHSDEVDGESKYHRFFAYLGLFCFSMLGLVIASSLLFLFIFWELVGLCSYLLIGYYFDKKSASNAAMKAFITNRVGDFGFIIGLGMVVLFLGDLTLDGAAKALRVQYAENGTLFAHSFLGLSLATWMGMLLFCGAIGKSAQFPLHVWLPDAMEGPTPVSALIHAATMVAAGVYLVARIFVLLTPEAQTFIAIIGCITLALAALIAIVQTDIKRVLAYSTISQLGYMILGMGLGAWIGALFHLLTHAFFKALMFLGSGQVIEGCHHEQDMRKMGGLRHKMPVTCWTFFIGVLAIAGAGIPMTQIGLGGFFSKDEILAVGWHRAYGQGEVDAAHEMEHAAAAMPGPWAQAQGAGHGAVTASDTPAGHGHEAAAGEHGEGHKVTPAWPAHRPGHWLLFLVPVVIAYVTPFYMMRAWWLTFMGKPRDEHVYHHAHESKLMYVPLIVLAVGTLFSSYFLFRPMVAEAVSEIGLQQALVASYDGGHHAEAGLAIDHDTHKYLSMIVGGAFVVGFLVAIAIYWNGLGLAERLARTFQPVHTLLVRKFYFDELYGAAFVGGVLVIKSLLYAFDKYIVDGIVNLSAAVTERLSRFAGNVLDARGVDGAVNGVGKLALELGGVVRTPQDGRIRNYILFALCGAGVVLLVVVRAWAS